MSSTHVPLLITPHLSISSAFTSLSLSSFHILLVNSYLSSACYLFFIISSSLVVRFPLCSFLFSVTKTTGSPSCSFMLKILQLFHLLLSAHAHQMTPIPTSPPCIAQIFTINIARKYAAYYTVEFLKATRDY
jgi:hypothetical protein